MSSYERGPLKEFEVIWSTGHVETVMAHQVLSPQSPGILGAQVARPTWMFHGEIDGDWQLLLAAHDDDIRSIRNVTHTRDAVEGFATNGDADV